ncbi:hypothetical protein LOD99_15902 [Oopsacas minuta]|uniref:Uncharacterized protein n=1 Tax=Oopsacas minuta TaxID=111878 RepID=A0AAV7K9Y1_9METZ|nr:hypothetical protein LOD99_15902 [Oopsacas minuta]
MEIVKENGASDVRMVIRADDSPDLRRYNAPTAPEIDVIMPGGGYTEGLATRDMVLNASSELLSLNGCKFNQIMLRIEPYSGLSDALSAGDMNHGKFGRRLILPSAKDGLSHRPTKLKPRVPNIEGP